MGVLAIVVNCYLIGQCGQLQRLFPWLSPEAAIVSVVVLEVGLVAGWRSWGAAGRPRACSLSLCRLSTLPCSSSISSTWPSPTSQAGWPRRWPSLSTSAGRPSRYTGVGGGWVAAGSQRGFSALPSWACRAGHQLPAAELKGKRGGAPGNNERAAGPLRPRDPWWHPAPGWHL